MTDDPLKFYRTVDRHAVYTVATEVFSHPFYPILRGFIETYDLQDKKCLEIGSSKGLFQDMVRDYTGVDVATSLTDHYHKAYVVASGSQLPFQSGSFAAVFTYATHEHIPDLETALEEIVRVLQPGGYCLFAPAWHTRPWFAAGYQVRPYKDLSLREKVIKATIPFRDAIIVRWPRVVSRRLYRLLIYSVWRSIRPWPLNYTRLKANYDVFWQSDSDACNSLDPFDVLLWMRSRNFVCHGHENVFKALFVRATALVVQKPG